MGINTQDTIVRCEPDKHNGSGPKPDSDPDGTNRVVFVIYPGVGHEESEGVRVDK